MEQRLVFIFFIFIGVSHSAFAQDLIDDVSISPQFAFRHAEQIGLTGEQKQAIESAVQPIQESAAPRHKKLESIKKELAELLKASEIDEAAALKKLGDVLEVENQLKQAQFQILLAVSKQLTPDQKQKLLGIKQQQLTIGGRQVEKRLRGKVEKIRQAIDSGKGTPEIHNMMQSFSIKMQSDQFRQAETVLDEALKLLGIHGSAGKFSLLPRTEPAKPFQSRTIASLQQEIDELRETKIGWRKIAWKTCLLDGLAASRRENKPIALWVFIDLPFDDKRC